MKVDLVYNPVAGSFRPARLDALAAAFAARGMEVAALPSARHGARLSGAADLVCVLGGDGTLRDTVEALGEDAGRTPLCIAPAGTINLVARELGYARPAARFADQVLAAWHRGRESWVRAPLYRLGTTPIVACLSIGPDSHAVAQVSADLKRRIGRYAYVVAVMRQLARWPRETIAISGELSDGTPFACEAEAAIASHGAFYAGPFRLSPRAGLAADSVELITLRRSTRIGTAALTGAAIMRLPLDRLGLAEIRTVRRVAFDRCVGPVQVDGDHMADCAHEIASSGMALNYVI
ncbi:diacylglycerol kinase family protein [Pelagerythrobacter marensis]|uniref:Diacylglycerol kinase family protein n=1 Tax=Pelagerythrobacter marensis TaxID=543877 RepID=A0ABZ2D1E8_9SPHN